MMVAAAIVGVTKTNKFNALTVITITCICASTRCV